MIVVLVTAFAVFLIASVAVIYGYRLGYDQGFDDANPAPDPCRVPLCVRRAVPGHSVCTAHWEQTVSF